MENNNQPALAPAARKILQARHHNPFTYLGRHVSHQSGKPVIIIRIILPKAISASLLEPALEFKRLDNNVIFELTSSDINIPKHYIIEWIDDNGVTHQHYDPYSFPEQVSEDELSLFIKGKQYNSNEILGAHAIAIDHIDGVLFTTWSPNAEHISVVGPFNDWDNRCHAMRTRGASGIWELFIPGLAGGEQYQFEIRNHHTGKAQLKIDPYAQQFATDKPHNSVVIAPSEYQWQDHQWMAQRATSDWQHKPISIYETHIDSRQSSYDDLPLNYRVLAEQLIAHIHDTGFTHIKLFAESPIKSGAGFFAPDSQHGTADDFRYFVDYCHQHCIGVILNWHIDQLPPHPTNNLEDNSNALHLFDGERLYEQGEHNPNIFDFSNNGVRSLLISSALYWLDSFHLDGLKLRTSTSMFYKNSKQNDDALSLLREINNLADQRYPGTLMLVEENTVWPMVTAPTASGGLGFSMKWNIGWHHDTLRYLTHEATARQAHHETLIFSQNYAFSENFVLSFSSQNTPPLLQQMPGKEPQRFANLRLLYSYMFTHPGKKLLFMGNEFTSNSEWQPLNKLPLSSTDKALRSGLSNMVGELNTLYRSTQALHYYDFDERGFEWIERHDSSQSLIVFQRNDEESCVVVALNFSAITRNAYRIGVTDDANYKEVFNSDSLHFGGEGRLNPDHIPTDNIPWMKHPYSLTITLPPLSAVVLKRL